MARPIGSLKHDLTAQRFGRLVVLRRKGSNKWGAVLWECLCNCGNIKLNQTGALRNGIVVSCGCHHKELVAKHQTIHGKCGTRTYRCWSNMIQRCTNKKNGHYKSYGAKGVKVCRRWRTFANFLADMGECPPKLTIDRIDPFGNYEPGNCRWLSKPNQQFNKRRKPS